MLKEAREKITTVGMSWENAEILMKSRRNRERTLEIGAEEGVYTVDSQGDTEGG